ncbi:LOW QUALITY PROTEIN: HARB1-like protein, partial [Mya arenaria]
MADRQLDRYYRYRRFRLPRRPRVFTDRNNPLEILDVESVRKRYRFFPDSIMILVGIVEPTIGTATMRSNPLPPLLTVLCCLQFFATGAHHIVIAQAHGVSRSAVGKAIHAVSVILAGLINRYVKFPTGLEIESVKRKFYSVAGFPNVVGAVDGTHVKIQAPPDNEADYKGLSFPECTGQIDGLLLGDSGYPCRKYLMTPYANPRNLSEERLPRRPRVFTDRNNPLEILDVESVRKRYRFFPDSIMILVGIVEPTIGTATMRSNPLPPLLTVLCCLQFFATGAHHIVIAQAHGVSRSAVGKAIHAVSVILAGLINRYVKFPTGLEIESVKRKFYSVAGFPNVVGAVDGTHVKIQAPPDNEADYVNRKGYHSLNVQ